MITEPSVPCAAPVAVPAGRRARITRSAANLARRHWMLVILLVAGLGLRVVTQIAYRPVLFYIDSYKYLTGSGGIDPEGYRFLIAPVLHLTNLAVVPALQHVLGLAMGLGIYAVLVRRGAPRWAGALAAAPILLDAYQLQMEQTLMPDVVFEAFILGGLMILLWRPRPSLKRLIVGALVLGMAADVRQIGELLFIPVALFAVLIARGGWRRLRYLVAGAVSCAVPMLVYMSVSQATGNGFTLAGHGPNVLYGRAAVAANCSTLKLPAYEKSLCPSPQFVALGIDRIVNFASGPYETYKPPAGQTRQQGYNNFIAQVVKQQPLAIPASVLRDAVRLFALTRDGVDPVTEISRWQFQTTYPVYPPGVTLQFVDEQAQHYGGGAPTTIKPLATFLRAYQLDGGYTPGPLLAVLTAGGFAGSLFGFARRRKDAAHARPQGPGGDFQSLAAGTLLVTVTALGVVLGSDVFEYSWRYQLPVLVLLPLAGVLGGAVIASRISGWRPRGILDTEMTGAGVEENHQNGEAASVETERTSAG
ncbi:MAG: hypothetical protein JO016_13080 [Actinobacteria bacterium]|nr:hypothetical protein [Actinomycetota bacterium]